MCDCGSCAAFEYPVKFIWTMSKFLVDYVDDRFQVFLPREFLNAFFGLLSTEFGKLGINGLNQK